MAVNQAYCTVRDVVGWGSKKEADLITFVRAASDHIARKIGDFVPITGTKRFDGTGGIDLTVPPLLTVTSITDDGDTLQSTDYLLYPRNRWWPDGPYTRIRIDPDATTLNAWTYEEDIVVIVGQWGLYNVLESTGATVSSQSDSATTLAVDDGSKIAPGAVLVIGSEKEFVTGTNSAVTDSTANTNEAVDASEDAIDVTDGAQLNIGEVIRIDNEQMLVNDILSNTVIVERGFNGTQRTTHNTSTDINVYRTFDVARGSNGTTAAAHTTASISKYVFPWNIQYLCKQIASLMAQKAGASYAGKTGNVELGEVYYHSEFPKDVMKEVEREYLKPRRFGA
jgi:hypothetical protein